MRLRIQFVGLQQRPVLQQGVREVSRALVVKRQLEGAGRHLRRQVELRRPARPPGRGTPRRPGIHPRHGRFDERWRRLALATAPRQPQAAGRPAVAVPVTAPPVPAPGSEAAATARRADGTVARDVSEGGCATTGVRG